MIRLLLHPFYQLGRNHSNSHWLGRWLLPEGVAKGKNAPDGTEPQPSNHFTEINMLFFRIRMEVP